MVDNEAPGKHHLWQKTKSVEVLSTDEEFVRKPVYKLRIIVVRNGEEVGGVPVKTFTFPSLHHLTHATNELDSAFSDAVSPHTVVRKSGVEAPNSEVEFGRGLEGCVENVSIDFKGGEGPEWKKTLERIGTLEAEWEGEGRGEIKL